MLALRGLEFRWAADAPALRFPDIELAQGARAVVRGRSGSGKSTLLALVAGLLTPSAGELRVADVAPAGLPARARDRWRGAALGVVPQRLHLADGLTVQQNLALPFVAAGVAVDGARIADVLARLGLAGLERRRPHELSVGQAQRVALARALLRRPRVLLADEPTAHLDDDSAAAALALLTDAAAEAGATLVVATHDARAAAALAPARMVQLGEAVR